MANQQNTNKVPELLQLTVEKHSTFNDVISTATLSSSTLEKEISELFGATFDDYEGCKITPVGPPNQQVLKCRLYFKPAFTKSQDGFYAVKVRGENINNQKRKGSSLAELVSTVNQLAVSKRFDLEEDAKELLAEFLMISDARIVERFNVDLGKVVNVRLPKNWNQYTEEITDAMTGTRFQTPYFVVNLDLLPIVSKMYGKKDAAEVAKYASRGIIPKDRFQYAVNIVKVLNPTMKQFILEIRRIDIKQMESISQSIGYGMVTGNIIMTRR